MFGPAIYMVRTICERSLSRSTTPWQDAPDRVVAFARTLPATVERLRVTVRSDSAGSTQMGINSDGKTWMTSQWSLSLEQSGDMGVMHGSLAVTADAVRSGADLRLFLIARGYEETLYFQQTYAGEGDTFAGMMTHHHSYAHRGNLAQQPYFSFFKYDAMGSFSLVKWMLDNVTYDEPQPYPYGIYRWYVCRRWRVVYEHDADGNRVDGDLDELRELIRTGRTLKVGIRQLFGIQKDDCSGPAHLVFLEIMQPLIKDGHVGANCDFILAGAPQWPFSWREGLVVGMVWPWSSGEIICHLVEPGHLPFRRTSVRRAMQWLVAEHG